MKITRNFDSKEFDCHDGTPYPIMWIESRLAPLCAALEKIRALTGGPLHVTSGYRTPEWNKSVGGQPKSKHMEGIAADIQLRGMTPKQLFAAIEKLIESDEIPEGGLGLYPRFVHYDLRGKRARW